MSPLARETPPAFRKMYSLSGDVTDRVKASAELSRSRL